MPEEEQQAQEGKKKSGLTKTLVLALIIAVVEGAGFFAVTKMFGGGPQASYGEEGEPHVLDGPEAQDFAETVEIEMLDRFRVPNDRSGRLYTYDISVALKVPGAREEDATKLVADRNREISDRVARIIRAADPPVLREPELQTIRTQLQQAIGEVIGDQDLIVEVLIPRCVPIRSD